MTIRPKETLAAVGYYMIGISKLPGFDEPIKLSSNESALGMSPAALAAAQQAIAGSHLYPEVDTETLAEALGERYGLDPARMAFGPGSDELLGRIVNTFAGPGEELGQFQSDEPSTLDDQALRRRGQAHHVVAGPDHYVVDARDRKG